MPRITINLDGRVLADLKGLRRKQSKPLGDLAFQLLASALADRKLATATAAHRHWTSRPMGALVDLDDKDALFAALDENPNEPRRR